MNSSAVEKNEHVPEPLSIHYNDDCDVDLIKGKIVTVIGYGSQGRPHALNLKDSGAKQVIIGLRDGSSSATEVHEDDLDVMPVAQAAAQADIVMMLTPDETHADIYHQDLERNMKSGAALMFAHGLSIHFDLIKPRTDIDVIMVAPKGAGYAVRQEYVRGAGIPCLIAVAQDMTGKAKDIALSYAAAIGGGRSGIIETTFKNECETDLFGEQAVLCGGTAELVKAGYETLVEAGYPPEMAYFECVHELKLVVDLIYERGLAQMQSAISNTAEFGGYVSGPRVINGETKSNMKRILNDIQSGKFAQGFMDGNKDGFRQLKNMRAKGAEHPMEKTGVKLRAMMPWIGADK